MQQNVTQLYVHVLSCSVMSDSLQYHGLQPARLLCPWNFPGENTGVSCYFLLQGISLTYRLNLRLLHWQTDSLPLGHLGSFNRIILISIAIIVKLKKKTLCPFNMTFFGGWGVINHQLLKREIKPENSAQYHGVTVFQTLISS